MSKSVFYALPHFSFLFFLLGFVGTVIMIVDNVYNIQKWMLSLNSRFVIAVAQNFPLPKFLHTSINLKHYGTSLNLSQDYEIYIALV